MRSSRTDSVTDHGLSDHGLMSAGCEWVFRPSARAEIDARIPPAGNPPLPPAKTRAAAERKYGQEQLKPGRGSANWKLLAAMVLNKREWMEEHFRLQANGQHPLGYHEVLGEKYGTNCIWPAAWFRKDLAHAATVHDAHLLLLAATAVAPAARFNFRFSPIGLRTGRPVVSQLEKLRMREFLRAGVMENYRLPDHKRWKVTKTNPRGIKRYDPWGAPVRLAADAPVRRASADVRQLIRRHRDEHSQGSIDALVAKFEALGVRLIYPLTVLGVGRETVAFWDFEVRERPRPLPPWGPNTSSLPCQAGSTGPEKARIEHRAEKPTRTRRQGSEIVSQAVGRAPLTMPLGPVAWSATFPGDYDW